MSDLTEKNVEKQPDIYCYSCKTTVPQEDCIKCLSCGLWFCTNCINKDDVCYDCSIVEHDAVLNPSHYDVGKMDTIDFIYDKQLEWCLGQCIKYVVRAGRKKDTPFEQDIAKAINYLQIAMERRNTCHTTKGINQHVSQ